MFYLNYVNRPNYSLLKTNPKEYWKQWQEYAKAQSNYQVWRANMESDRMYTSMMMKDASMNNILSGLPCMGCTLGSGFGIFM